MSFEWMGKNSDGVPQYVGDRDRPTALSICGFFSAAAVFGVGIGIMACLALTSRLELGRTATIWLAIAGPFDILFFGGIGAWYLYLRRQIARLVPEMELGKRLGIDEDEVSAFIQVKGIRPRMGVNLRSYYALEDFDEAASLLRASHQSTADTRSLVRPVPADTAIEVDGLLRPSTTQ